MRTRAAALASCLLIAATAWADQPSVQVLPPNLQGSRQLESQTAKAVVRDYLESWQKFSAALNHNQAALLDPDFVGTAREKLAATIADQQKTGIHTHYTAQTHNLQVVFYSQDGRSLQMVDNCEYDEQVIGQNGVLATQHVKTRYLIVMTPAEVRWKVRFFQAVPD